MVMNYEIIIFTPIFGVLIGFIIFKIIKKRQVGDHKVYFSKDSFIKNLKKKILNIKGRKFILKNFYDGIVRLTFKEVCDKNLGSEDYIKIVKNCFFIVMENVPAFNDLNSNQQQRFITFLDIVYDQNIPMAISAEQNIDKLTSSRLLEKPFKRTISRLYELTSKKYL